MKKLSLLVALALLITVGGVYATWTYIDLSANIPDSQKEIVIELEDAETSGAAGTFHVSSNLSLIIDQDNTAAVPHSAKLVYCINGEPANDDNAIALTVTFDPSDHASLDIRNNAVPAELYFTLSTAMEYPARDGGYYDSTNGTNKAILKIANPSDGDLDPNITWGDPDPNTGVFTAKYTLADIKDEISLNTPIVLDTLNDYNAFRNCLGGNIVARVTDGTVDNNTP